MDAPIHNQVENQLSQSQCVHNNVTHVKSLFDMCIISLFDECLKNTPSKFIKDVNLVDFVKQCTTDSWIILTTDDFLYMKDCSKDTRPPCYPALCKCAGQWCSEAIYWKTVEERYPNNTILCEHPLVCSFECYKDLRIHLKIMQNICGDEKAGEYLVKLRQFYPHLENDYKCSFTQKSN